MSLLVLPPGLSSWSVSLAVGLASTEHQQGGNVYCNVYCKCQGVLSDDLELGRAY